MISLSLMLPQTIRTTLESVWEKSNQFTIFDEIIQKKNSGKYVQNNSKYPSLCSINFLQFKLYLFFRQIDNFNFMLQNLTPNFGWKVKLANTANFKTWNNKFMRPKVNCWKHVHICTYDINTILLYLYFFSSSQYGWHILSGGLYLKFERFLIF